MATGSGETEGGRRGNWVWYLLLIIPFIGVLWVPFYNSLTPAVAGVPFFYWYLFVWIIVSSALAALVYVATRE
jgi:hypothetical protein